MSWYLKLEKRAEKIWKWIIVELDDFFFWHNNLSFLVFFFLWCLWFRFCLFFDICVFFLFASIQFRFTDPKYKKIIVSLVKPFFEGDRKFFIYSLFPIFFLVLLIFKQSKYIPCGLPCLAFTLWVHYRVTVSDYSRAYWELLLKGFIKGLWYRAAFIMHNSIPVKLIRFFLDHVAFWLGSFLVFLNVSYQVIKFIEDTMSPLDLGVASVLMVILTLPLIGLFFITCCWALGRNSSGGDKVFGWRIENGVNLQISLILFLLCQVLWYFFDYGFSGYQFRNEASLGFFCLIFPKMNTFFEFGLDGISFWFFYLTALIFPLCFLSSFKRAYNFRFFSVCLWFLEFFLLISFSTMDILVFYVSFEAVLIPMFFMIGCWGSGFERITGAYYFFFFTLVGSLFFLVGIFILFINTGGTNFELILNTYFSWELEVVLFFCLGIGFAVKMPLFPFHTWLPEAHVQAPTEGSVILASLLLKLGGYGFLRVLIPIAPTAMRFFSPGVIVLAVCGVVYASMMASIQLDFKKLIAYSSIAHMNLVVIGIFSFNLIGLQGAIFLMLAHGIVSSGLFFLVGFLYDRHMTRTIPYYSGLVTSMPIFTVLFFNFLLANISFPATSNFVGEILILVALMQDSFFLACFAALGIIWSVVYSIILGNSLAYKQVSRHIEKFRELTRLEVHILVFLLILVYILGIKPDIILDLTFMSVSSLLV